jgi:hypothetical protein
MPTSRGPRGPRGPRGENWNDTACLELIAAYASMNSTKEGLLFCFQANLGTELKQVLDDRMTAIFNQNQSIHGITLARTTASIVQRWSAMLTAYR